MNEWDGSSIYVLHGFNSCRKSAEEDATGFAKTFPEIPCVSQMLGGPSLRRGIPTERLSISSRIGWGGNDTCRLVTWDCALRTDSASWKSLESFMQLISFCNSCVLPVSSRIVSWSSTNLRLATVSKVELWNFFNYSILWNFYYELRVIPNFAVITVHEEVVDFVVEVLLLERNKSFLLRFNNFIRILNTSSIIIWLEWHSTRIRSFCLSKRVQICAFPTFSSWPLATTSLPVLSTTGLPVRSDTDDDWPTDKLFRWES